MYHKATAILFVSNLRVFGMANAHIMAHVPNAMLTYLIKLVRDRFNY